MRPQTYSIDLDNSCRANDLHCPHTHGWLVGVFHTYTKWDRHKSQNLSTTGADHREKDNLKSVFKITPFRYVKCNALVPRRQIKNPKPYDLIILIRSTKQKKRRDPIKCFWAE